MNENPWSHLPHSPPFVLPVERECVERFNAKVASGSNLFLQVEKILPEPFVGDPESPVVLLSNNPGYRKGARLRERQDFMEKMRNNLRHGKSKYPFVYLDPDISGPWWRQKLKHLISRFGCEVVARSVLNVPYFPYPSVSFRHRKLDLPSQTYSFDLVRAAMRRGRLVVLMRTGKLEMWLSKVSELDGYDGLIHLLNPRNPAISPGNCREGDYERIVAAIVAAEQSRTANQ